MSKQDEKLRKIVQAAEAAFDKFGEACAAYVDRVVAALEWFNDCGKLIAAGVTEEEWMRLSSVVRRLVIRGLGQPEGG